MERQLNGVEQEVIITNNNLLLHFSGHNDLLVLKQWKGALNPRPSQNNDLGLRDRSLFLRRPWVKNKRISWNRHPESGRSRL